jgi:cytochrome c biogenesis protein CcmG/thiol:disulfide interchange protein DsbE
MMERLGDEAAGDELAVPRRGRTGLVVSLVVAVLAAALVWVLATGESGTDRRASSDRIGLVAPPLAGETLGGESFDIADQQGRWVVVNVFATWCVPCRREHPELVRFHEAHRRAGDVALISVLYDDEPATARTWFERNGGEWPVVLDPDGRIAVDYGVAGVPETYLVAPNGRVAAKLIGGVTQDGLDRIIAEVEGGRGGGGP